MAHTLVASAARTETNTGTDAYVLSKVNRLSPGYRAIEFILDVTAAATQTGDTLDAFVQTKVADSQWVDVVAFTQVVGDGGAVTHVAKIVVPVAQAMFETGATLSAGSVRNIFGDEWRGRWDVTDASTDDASFTFSITMRVLD